MGFYKTVGSKILDKFKEELADKLPILDDNESYCSDLDFFIKIANAFENEGYFRDGTVTDMTISASHLGFEFQGIPVAVFNMVSGIAESIVEMFPAAQGILDIKEGEISNWEAEYEERQHATIILELGSAETIKENEHLFAKSAQKTNDQRYIIKHNNF